MALALGLKKLVVPLKVKILHRRKVESTSKIPSAKMRTALMIVSFDVESVTSTWGWRAKGFVL